MNSHVNLFGRYSYAPADLQDIGAGRSSSLNDTAFTHSVTQFLTTGSTWSNSQLVANEFRFNYSRNSAASTFRLDGFGGAVVPPDSDVFTTPFSSQNAQFAVIVLTGQQLSWTHGKNTDNRQRQLNIIDNLSIQRGSHNVKLGVDYRWISPVFNPRLYSDTALFFTVPSLVAGNPFLSFVSASQEGILHLHNFSAFAQDTWRATPRLTLTYGVRWELDPPPSSGSKASLLAITGIQSLSTLNVAPSGTSLWKTTYGNFAPRVGGAYQINSASGRETVIRGGFGLFY